MPLLKAKVLAPRCVQRGFTLLEMLVALTVASIMLGVVAVRLMPDEQAALREEAERMAFLMESGGMAARAAGQVLAWSGAGNEYRFWKKNKQGEWVRIEQGDMLHPRSMAGTVRIAGVELAERNVQAGEKIVLSPELAAPMFRIRLASGKKQIVTSGNGLGAVSVVVQQ